MSYSERSYLIDPKGRLDKMKNAGNALTETGAKAKYTITFDFEEKAVELKVKKKVLPRSEDEKHTAKS